MPTEEVKEPMQDEAVDDTDEVIGEEEPEEQTEEADAVHPDDAEADEAEKTEAEKTEAEADDDWDDWDDWDDDTEDPEKPEAEAEESGSAEETEDGDAEPPEAQQTEESPEPKNEQSELLDRLLSDMGYEGTTEEKVAKYKADNGDAEKRQETAPAPLGVEERAKRDLETLTKAYPDRMKGIKSLNEIPQIDPIVRKMVQTGCSMLDAYNDIVVGNVQSARAVKQKAQEQSKNHLVGTVTTQRASRYDPDTAEMRELRRSLPGYSEARIRELYRKVQKNTK